MFTQRSSRLRTITSHVRGVRDPRYPKYPVPSLSHCPRRVSLCPSPNYVPDSDAHRSLPLCPHPALSGNLFFIRRGRGGLSFLPLVIIGDLYWSFKSPEFGRLLSYTPLVGDPPFDEGRTEASAPTRSAVDHRDPHPSVLSSSRHPPNPGAEAPT